MPDLRDNLQLAHRWIEERLGALLHQEIPADRSAGTALTEGAQMFSFGEISFEDMAQITLDAIGDAVLVVDPDGRVIYLNKVAETLTGWPREEALGRKVEDVFFIIDGNTREREVSPGERAIRESKTVGLALGSVLIRRDGSDMAIEDSAAPILNRHDKVAGAVIVFHDARESRLMMDKMSHLAQHDFLTGLPNRSLLFERLTQAMGMAGRHGTQLALLFIDLDGFKVVNDNHGHAVGDHLLREVADDVLQCVRTTDTVSRIGGDEFVVLLTQIENMEDATQVADKLLARFARPRTIDGFSIQVAMSIGIATYPDDATNAEALLASADRAMYVAKERGGGCFHQELPAPATAQVAEEPQ